MSTTAQGQIVITGDTTSGQAALDGLDRRMARTTAQGGKLQTSMRGSMLAVTAKAAAVTALIASVRRLNRSLQDLAKVAEDNDRAMRRAARGMQNFGASSEGARAMLQSLADELQRTTRFAAGDVLSAYATLEAQTQELGITHGELVRALRLSADVAEELGTGIEQASRRVTRAIEGEARAMRELGIQGNTLEERMASLEKRYGGTAKQADSLSAFTDQLSNGLADQKDELGRVITESQAFREALQLVNDTMSGFLTVAQAVVTSVEALRTVWTSSITTIGDYEVSLRSVTRSLNQYVNPANLAIRVTQMWVGELRTQLGLVNDNASAIDGAAEAIEDYAGSLRLANGEEFIKKDLQEVLAAQALARLRRENERLKTMEETVVATQRITKAERELMHLERVKTEMVAEFLRAEEEAHQRRLQAKDDMESALWKEIHAEEARAERIRRSMDLATQAEAQTLSAAERRYQLLNDLDIDYYDSRQVRAMNFWNSDRSLMQEGIASRIALRQADFDATVEARDQILELRRQLEADLEEDERVRLERQLEQWVEYQRLRVQEFEDAERERARVAQQYTRAIDSFAVGSVNRMTAVYAGASKEQAKERRRALGDGLMAEGLANVLSAPVRFFTQGPQAAKISAATGAAQVAFGRTLGGSLGARGGGGGGGPAERETVARERGDERSITQNYNTNFDVGLAVDPRETARQIAEVQQRNRNMGYT